MNVRDDAKLVEIWLTSSEKNDPVIRAGLKDIYDKYRGTKYLVAVYESGSRDLHDNTLALLKYNRKRSAEQAIQQAKVAAGKEKPSVPEKLHTSVPRSTSLIAGKRAGMQL